MIQTFNRPAVASTSIDDSTFTTASEWLDALTVELIAARNAGISCLGQARVAIDVANRMFPDTVNIPWQTGDTPWPFLDTGTLKVLMDGSLASDTAIVE